MKILLLEDDTLLNEIIEEFLEELGHKVISTFDGQEALETIYEHNFDLLLLDVNVPSLNGFDLLKSLKNNSIDTASIYITSLQLSELNLRINNISRLRQIEKTGLKVLSPDISYNYDTKNITMQTKQTHLSKTEAKIFEYFLKNENRTISIEELSLNNWIYDEIPTATTIRTYIKNLRKIIGKDRITTIKGVGYQVTFK